MKQMLGKQDEDPNAGLGRQITNSKTTLKFKSLKDIKYKTMVELDPGIQKLGI